jgi:hypothetical protein
MPIKYILVSVILFFIAIPLHAQYALDFDGVDDYVEVPHDPSLEFDSEISVEVWFKVEDVLPDPPQRIFGKVVDSGYSTFSIFLNQGNIRGVIRGLVLSIDGGSVEIGVWNHVAFAYDGEMARFRLNGVVMDSSFFSDSLKNEPTPVTFGRFNDHYGQYFEGSIDEARLWNVGRTGEEIRSTMNVELSGTEEGLIGYWKFNEGVDDSIFDSSVYGNHGQLGSTSGPDASDPTWIDSGFPPSPVLLNIFATGPTTIQIGDILQFSTYIQNNREVIVEGDYWLSVQLPNMSEFLIPDRLLNYSNPLSGQVFPLGTVEFENELWVHPRADTGSYQLIGRIGQYPGIIGDEDSFGFRVVE